MFVSCLWFLRSLHRSPRSLFEVTLDDIGGANAEIDRSLSSRRAKDDIKDAEDRVEAKAEAKADPDANGTTGPTQEGSWKPQCMQLLSEFAQYSMALSEISQVNAYTVYCTNGVQKHDGAMGKFVDAQTMVRNVSMSFITHITHGFYIHLMFLCMDSIFTCVFVPGTKEEWPLQLARDLMPRTSFAQQNVAS